MCKKEKPSIQSDDLGLEESEELRTISFSKPQCHFFAYWGRTFPEAHRRPQKLALLAMELLAVSNSDSLILKRAPRK